MYTTSAMMTSKKTTQTATAMARMAMPGFLLPPLLASVGAALAVTGTADEEVATLVRPRLVEAAASMVWKRVKRSPQVYIVLAAASSVAVLIKPGLQTPRLARELASCD